MSEPIRKCKYCRHLVDKPCKKEQALMCRNRLKTTFCKPLNLNTMKILLLILGLFLFVNTQTQAIDYPTKIEVVDNYYTKAIFEDTRRGYGGTYYIVEKLDNGKWRRYQCTRDGKDLRRGYQTFDHEIHAIQFLRLYKKLK